MFDPRQENPTYVSKAFQDRNYTDLHDRAFKCCMHYPEDTEIVEEAENVIVLQSGPRVYYPEGLIHVWVYLETWSSCKTFSPSVWNNLDMPYKMADLQERLRFLKTLTA